MISAPTVKNVRHAGDSVVYTSLLAPGAAVRAEPPIDGNDVWRTVTVSQNGKVLRRTTYYSHYSMVTGVLMIGRVGAPAIPLP